MRAFRQPVSSHVLGKPRVGAVWIFAVVLWQVAGLVWPPLALAAEGATDAGPAIPIASMQTIVIAADAHPADRQVAELLRDRLEKLYGVKATLKTGDSDGAISGILVGRAAVTAAGRISAVELEAVKIDGFVLRADAGWVSLAGYAPQGTLYAGYALLRKLGLKIYPWYPRDGVEVFTPLADRALAPFHLVDQPFFEYRNVQPDYDRGRFGASLRQYGLGDFGFARAHPYFKDGGWLAGDHTAAYLVPPAKYAAEHPEYYADKSLKDLLSEGMKGVRNLRVSLCMCEPEVHDIAAERALEWIGQQPERRFFFIANGDVTDARCERCAASDPLPDYYTDRYLRWVNSVARRVRARYPDKTVFALAYLGTVKPPVAVTALEPNVVVLFAPWYWTSQTTSAVPLSSPVNRIGWEELRSWVERFPGQVGVYDYPGSAYGEAARIKEFAALGVRWVHLNGFGDNDLTYWVSSQLLWNPALDTGPLVAEFLVAYYGPAADIMGRLLALNQQAVERAADAGSLAFMDEDLVRQMLPLLGAAATAAASTEGGTRVRILDGVGDYLASMLRWDRYGSGLPAGTLREVFQRYLTVREQVWEASEALLGSTPAIRARLYREAQADLAACTGAKPVDGPPPEVGPADRVALFEKAQADFEPVLARIEREQAAFPGEPVRAVGVRFGVPGEETAWRTEAVPSDVASPARQVEIQVVGETLPGVEIAAPLGRLPTVRRGNVTVHAGRFFAERVFDPPLEARGLPFIDLHLYASRPVPVTVYVNRKDKLRSDVRLVAGEQIVRIDLRNYRGTRFDPDSWNGKIEDIALDLWPQDFFYPYPGVEDTRIVLFGVRAGNQTASEVRWSDRTVTWVKQLQPNVPYGESVLSAIERSALAAGLFGNQKNPILEEYSQRWIKEGFRTFTSGKIMTPLSVLQEQ